MSPADGGVWRENRPRRTQLSRVSVPRHNQRLRQTSRAVQGRRGRYVHRKWRVYVCSTMRVREGSWKKNVKGKQLKESGRVPKPLTHTN